MSELTAKQAELQEQESQIKERLAKIQTELLDQTKALGSAESDVKGYEEKLAILQEGFVENEELLAEVTENLELFQKPPIGTKKRQELVKLQAGKNNSRRRPGLVPRSFNKIIRSMIF